MSEAHAISMSERPATRASLRADLEALGVQPGMTVMVHAALSRLGFVVGGAQAVVEALLDAVGAQGTIMMPTHSNHLSEPSSWSRPPVPEAWWQSIREEMPAFDPLLTPTREMGAVVECFRHVPGVRRSTHPCMSAAAVGPNASRLVDDHPLDHALGESSPQARLYELDGHVLLLGVSHANNTSLHLSEYRSPPPGGYEALTYASAIAIEGERRWVTYDAIPEDDSDFAALGEAFAETGAECHGRVGSGTGRLMRSREIVDYGVDWIAENRHRRG